MLLQLPQHCLLIVFKELDLCSHMMLANVCTSLKIFIRTHVFHKITNFSVSPLLPVEIIPNMIAVSRFVRLMNPTSSDLKMYRNLEMAKEMPIISVDISHSSSPCEVFVESHFLEYLRYMELFSSRVESIKILCSIYDAHINDGCDLTNFASWSNLKNLSIGGFDGRTIHLIDFPENAWELKTISLHNMGIGSRIINDVARISKHLETITFEHCKCRRFLPQDIIAAAEGVRDRGGHWPLGLIFVNVSMKGDALLWVIDLFGKEVEIVFLILNLCSFTGYGEPGCSELHLHSVWQPRFLMNTFMPRKCCF